MAEYGDSDLKGLMDVFQVKAEIEDSESVEMDEKLHAQEVQESRGEEGRKDHPADGSSPTRDNEDGYMMISEENGNQDESVTLNDEESALLQDDPDNIHGSFDAEPEDLSTTMDQNEDQDSAANSSVLYNVLSQGASPTMQQISMGDLKKRFDCRWCKASFTKKTSLRRHMNLHSGSRPFQCPFCEYNATRKDQLKTHIKTRHTRDSSKHFTFKCPLCSDMFQSQKRMTLHMRSHQWDNFPCDLCHIKFKSANELVQHLKRRHPDSGTDPGNYPYVCDVCHRWCHSIEEYVDHIQTHPQKADSLDGSPEVLDDRDSPINASRSNGQSRSTNISILEQALSKGSSSSSSRNRYPSGSSSSSQRANHPRPTSKVLVNSPSTSMRVNSTSRPPSTQNSSMLSTLLQGGSGRSMSPISPNTGPYIVKAVSLHESRDVLRYPHYPVRNQSPLSNSSSARMPSNVVSPTVSRDSRESLEVHSPQLSSVSSVNRYQNMNTVDSSTQDEVMRCEHCHIIFADSIMYAIHMGCHDWQEPFRCNICAFHCADRYEFMSHITRGLHQKKKNPAERN